MTQQVTTPIPEADIEMIPPTRDAAKVSEDISRVWATVFGKDGGLLRPALVSKDGALAVYDPPRNDGTFTAGAIQPTGALREPFPGEDFDYLDVICDASMARIECTDANGVLVDRRFLTPTIFTGGVNLVSVARFYVRARKYQLFPVTGALASEAIIAWKRNKPVV